MGEVDLDTYEASTTRKCIAESALEAGQKASKGFVTAKGWWMGIDAKSGGEVTYSIQIPVSSSILIDDISLTMHMEVGCSHRFSKSPS